MVTRPGLPLPDLPGLDPAWSRAVQTTDRTGAQHTWHLLDNGREPTIGTLLCVHGNPTWSYLWRRLLADAPSGWRVVAPDQLGMGWSERLERPRTLAERVDDLGDLTDELGTGGPVVTVGHDWGGAISLGWALAHRDQVRGVVLTNTAVAQPEHDRGPALIRLAHIPLVREAVCRATPAFVVSTSALSRPALPRDVRRALASPYRSAARRGSVADFVADIPFDTGHPSRPALEAIAGGVCSLDVPTLLLWGPRDPVFGERYLADLRSRMPHAQLHRYEGASHLVTEDAPQYADAVGRWLGDLDQPPAAAGAAPATAPVAGETGSTLWSALDDRAADTGDLPAVVEVGGETISWRDLATRVRDLAAGLAAAGVRPGHRVALLVEPSVDLTATVYAVWRAGAVIVVADKGLGLRGMRRALRSAAPDHVVGGLPGLAAARLMGLPASRIAATDLRPAARRGLGVTHTLAELAALGRRPGTPDPARPDADADCAVVFTSGATGPAKGVVYRHRQVLAQLALLRSTYALGPQDRLVAAFAPFALLGPALGIGSAVPAIDVTKPGTLTAQDLAAAVAAVSATVVFASPAALRNVLATEAGLDAGARSALGGVRLLMSAGAPVPVTLLDALQNVLPHADPHTPYGMTEALPVTDVSLAELEKAGAGDGVCVGRPLPGVDLALSPLSAVGAADGPLTPEAGTLGEICVRAGHVKDRYDALWATQRESAREPGWHRTGDVGHLDTDGRLWVEGRLVHVITTASAVVTPVGVEQRVEGLPGVRAAAAVGIGPAGAQVVAVVVVHERTSSRRAGHPRPAGQELTEGVRSVAGVDVAAVLVVDRLPLDIRHASKIDRAEVARRASRVLAGG